jgi:hypothetical protein
MSAKVLSALNFCFSLEKSKFAVLTSAIDFYCAQSTLLSKAFKISHAFLVINEKNGLPHHLFTKFR